MLHIPSFIIHLTFFIFYHLSFTNIYQHPSSISYNQRSFVLCSWTSLINPPSSIFHILSSILHNSLSLFILYSFPILYHRSYIFDPSSYSNHPSRSSILHFILYIRFYFLRPILYLLPSIIHLSSSSILYHQQFSILYHHPSFTINNSLSSIINPPYSIFHPESSILHPSTSIIHPPFSILYV
jgi:hypothetical protein